MSGIEIRIIRDGDFPILWVSRHPPLKSQVDFLVSKFGNPKIVQISGRIPNAEFVVEVAQKHGAKVIIPVLPLSFIARLVELSRKVGFEVWWAEMEQTKIIQHEPIANKDYNPETDAYIKGYEGTYKIMRFKKFHRIKRIVMEVEEVERMTKIVVSRIPLENNVILEYLPNGRKEYDEYKILKTFDNIKEAKKWIRENPEEVKKLIEKYGTLYLTSVRACYLIGEEDRKCLIGRFVSSQ